MNDDYDPEVEQALENTLRELERRVLACDVELNLYRRKHAEEIKRRRAQGGEVGDGNQRG